jgi:hypothetical protein
MHPAVVAGTENAASQHTPKSWGHMQRQTLSNFTDQCQFSKIMAKKSLWNEYYYYTTK